MLAETFDGGTLGAFASQVATCVPGGCGWSAVQTAARSTPYAAFAPDLGAVTDERLVISNPLTIPVGSSYARLSFWHRYDFENGFDGGILEVSTNGGTSWANVGASNIITGTYTGTIVAGTLNPISGQPGWRGSTSGAFVPVVINLLPYAGQTVLFRYRLGTDGSGGGSGWWIDDVDFTLGGPCPSPTGTNTPTGTPPSATPTITLTPSNTPTNTPSYTPTRTPTSTRTHTPTVTLTVTGTPPTATPIPTICSLTRTGQITSGFSFTRPYGFVQGAPCLAATSMGLPYYSYYEYHLDSPGSVLASYCDSDATLGDCWSASFIAIYQAPGGAAIPGFVPNACANAVAAAESCTTKATLSAGYFYVVISAQVPGTGGKYKLDVTRAAEDVRNGEITAGDPTFRPAQGFAQGGVCASGSNPAAHYDVHEFLAYNPATIVASTCNSLGGNADFGALISVYQAPAGARMPNFTPNACTQALVADLDSCASAAGTGPGIAARAQANVSAGYFYIVVSGYNSGNSGLGKYKLAVMGLASCGPQIAPPTWTVTPTPTRTLSPTPVPTQTCPPVQMVIGPGSPSSPVVVRGSDATTDEFSGAPDNSQPSTGVHSGGRQAELPNVAPVTFQLDDGLPEYAFYRSYYASGSTLWLNRFTPPPGAYPVMLDGIQVRWPNREYLFDQQIRLLVYLDADGDNNPSNATLLYQEFATISVIAGFQNYPISLNINSPTGAGDIYIGFEDYWQLNGGSDQVAALDTTDPQGRSWVVYNSEGPPDINYLDSNNRIATWDYLNPTYQGNWMIRATGTTALRDCGPTSTPTGTVFTPTRTRTPVTPLVTNTATATVTKTPGVPMTVTPTPTFCAGQTPLSEGFESGLGTFASVSTATPTTIPAGWRTVTGTVYSGVYSAYAPDLGTLSDQWLSTSDSVYIPSNATSAVLTFRHRYDFEMGSVFAYDGGLLEISRNGGPWDTITPNGGGISYSTSGGYNGTLWSSNIAGSQLAWSGSTNGQFAPVTVNLLPNALGQEIRFRFRLVTDPTVGSGGWYIDDLKVTIGYSCGTSTPTATVTPTRTSTPTATPLCNVVATAGDLPKLIPDYAPGTPGVVTSTLSVSGIGPISKLELTGLVISHTWTGDLKVGLTSPGGNTVLLIDRVCNATRNMDFSNITLDDNTAQIIGSGCPVNGSTSYRPTNPLAAFNGESASGIWTLTVSDNAIDDTGTLLAWGLRINSSTSCLLPGMTPTSTYTPTPSATPTSAALIVGHVIWQGRPAQPSALQQLPITMSLRLSSGGTSYEFPGPGITMTTDASGFFTVSVGSLPQGMYNFRAKGPTYLAVTGTLTLAGQPAAQVEMGAQRPGDVDGNNNVGLTDFNLLKATYGKSSTDLGFDRRCDFDGNDAIGLTDFNLLKTNYGQLGGGPVGPEGALLSSILLRVVLVFLSG